MTDERIEAAANAIGHYYCEDCWYSCPLAPDGCCDDAQPADECNCGLTERVAKALAAADAVEESSAAATRSALRQLAEKNEATKAVLLDVLNAPGGDLVAAFKRARAFLANARVLVSDVSTEG